MIITVISVGMMKVVANEVVHVIAVGDTLMGAIGTVSMSLVVPRARVVGRAPVRIGVANIEHVFIHMIGMRMMQMAVMQIVDMSCVVDRHVTARRTVLMRMIRMFRAGAHGDLLLQ